MYTYIYYDTLSMLKERILTAIVSILLPHKGIHYQLRNMFKKTMLPGILFFSLVQSFVFIRIPVSNTKLAFIVYV